MPLPDPLDSHGGGQEAIGDAEDSEHNNEHQHQGKTSLQGSRQAGSQGCPNHSSSSGTQLGMDPGGRWRMSSALSTQRIQAAQRKQQHLQFQHSVITDFKLWPRNNKFFCIRTKNSNANIKNTEASWLWTRKTDDLCTYAIVEWYWVLWQEAIPTITETVPETSIPV